MKITLNILANELQGDYPELCVAGEANAEIKSVQMLRSMLSTKAISSQCILCASWEMYAKLQLQAGCFLLINAPKEVRLPVNAILLETAESTESVFQKVQEILIRIFGWKAAIMELSTYTTDLQALMDAGESVFSEQLYLISLLDNEIFASNQQDIDKSMFRKLLTSFYGKTPLSPAQTQHLTRYFDAKEPYFFHMQEREGDLLVQNIFLDNIRVAIIVLRRINADTDKNSIVYLKFLAQCVQRSFQNIAKCKQNTVAEKMLHSLVSGEAASQTILHDLYRELGWSAEEQTFRILVFRAQKGYETFFHANLLALRNHIRYIFPQCSAILFQESILLLYHDTVDKKQSDLQQVLLSAARSAHAVTGYSIPFSNLCHVPIFYRQAYSAAGMESSDNGHDYGTYLLYDIINSFSASHALEHYIHPDILVLAKQEEEGHASLLISLYLYLLNDRSYKLSAAKLNIHRNTFGYHITKVLHLLSCNLENENVRMSLLLSICMYWYLHPEKDPIGITKWNA